MDAPRRIPQKRIDHKPALKVAGYAVGTLKLVCTVAGSKPFTNDAMIGTRYAAETPSASAYITRSVIVFILQVFVANWRREPRTGFILVLGLGESMV